MLLTSKDKIPSIFLFTFPIVDPTTASSLAIVPSVSVEDFVKSESKPESKPEDDFKPAIGIEELFQQFQKPKVEPKKEEIIVTEAVPAKEIVDIIQPSSVIK